MRWFKVLLFAFVPVPLVAQNLGFEYERGTCVVVVWKPQAIAVAAESLVKVDKNRPTLQSCKIQRYSPSILVFVTGVATINDRTGHQIWDAKVAAQHLLRQNNPKNKEGLIDVATLWKRQVEKLISDRVLHLDGQVDGTVVVELGLLLETSSSVSLARVVFTNKHGIIVVKPAYLVEAPLPYTYKLLRYGSCTRYIGENPSEKRNSQEEGRFDAMIEQVKNAANDDQMRVAAVNAVALAIDVDKRTASKSRTLGGTISSTVYNVFTGTSVSRPVPPCSADFY